MGRSIPFEPEDTCDLCGAEGAYDVMGDSLCHKCMMSDISTSEPYAFFDGPWEVDFDGNGEEPYDAAF